MGWRDTWYPNTMAALCELRGRGPLGSDGIATPLIKSVEAIAVLGSVTKPIANALTSFQCANGVDDNCSSVYPSLYVSNGRLTNSAYVIPGISGQIRPMAKYLGGYAPDKTQPWRRQISGEGSATYEIGYGSSKLVAETALFMEARQLIAAWDRMCEAAASALRSSGTDVNRTIAASDAAALFMALRQVCTSLDILKENPPTSTYDKVKGAASETLNQVADFAGEAAADLAGKVGETAGRIGEGFFREAGFMSYLVAGIAVLLFMR